MDDAFELAIGFLAGLASSAAFVLALFVGVCTLIGFAKLRRTAGGRARVVKSLDEAITGEPFAYLPSTVPRGPVDQLRTPERLDTAARPG